MACELEAWGKETGLANIGTLRPWFILREQKTDLEKETADGWCPLSDAVLPMEHGTAAVCSVLTITAHCVQGLAEPDSYITPCCNRQRGWSGKWQCTWSFMFSWLHKISSFTYFHCIAAASQFYDSWLDLELRLLSGYLHVLPLSVWASLVVPWFSPLITLICLMPCDELASHSLSSHHTDTHSDYHHFSSRAPPYLDF